MSFCSPLDPKVLWIGCGKRAGRGCWSAPHFPTVLWSGLQTELRGPLLRCPLPPSLGPRESNLTFSGRLLCGRCWAQFVSLTLRTRKCRMGVFKRHIREQTMLRYPEPRFTPRPKAARFLLTPTALHCELRQKANSAYSPKSVPNVCSVE